MFFRFDEVKYLGNFIEFVGGNPSQIEYVKKVLHLTKKCDSSYYNLMNENSNINRNIKLKIKDIPTNVSTPKKITQYFLDTSVAHCNFMIKSLVNPINDISDASIMVDDDKYIISVKYGKNYVRQKKEKEVDKSIAEMLISNFAMYLTEKISYKVYEDKHHKIDVDEYLSIPDSRKPVILLTMNFDNETKKDALDFLLKKVKVSDYEDVTENLNYKNKNLSRPAK